MIFPSQFRGFHVHAQEFNYTTSGNEQIWTRPAGITKVTVTLVAGGAAGKAETTYEIGGGGGEVAVCDLVINGNLTIVIGRGGLSNNYYSGEDSYIKNAAGNVILICNGGILGYGGGTPGVRSIEGISYCGGGYGGGKTINNITLTKSAGIASAGNGNFGGGGSYGKGGDDGGGSYGNGENGMLGGGGGGCFTGHTPGQGGNGYCKIEWVA